MRRGCAQVLIVAALLAGGLAGAEGRESLRLRITNAVGGAIETSTDGAATWQRIGSVVVPADRVNPASYTAAGWAHDSAIAATAVNAIHIKVAANPQTGRPMTLSLVPGGEMVGAATRQRSSAIVTDIPGGSSIFGGGLGPYVNSPVVLEPSHTPLPPDYQPHEGDVLLVSRIEPTRLPLYAVFENRPGGAITLDYGEGPVPAGVVDRPVTGIGRFEGGLYCWPGRVRANHPGVIDVSTAPHGMIGGFQIIPRKHSQSTEMAYALSGHQWLIIGPADDAPELPGRPPFFSGTILPSYRPDDILGDYADWVQRVWSRTIVEVRLNGGPWELMPRIAFSSAVHESNEAATDRGRRGLWLIPGKPRGGKAMEEQTRESANHALDGVTHLRVVFPLTTFPPPTE
ncbi:MAG: hypothetical protein KKI08_20005 [Armatimonadetes bacterium]|nr:hypothetical protein [Armatimonadota bacterium]